MPPFTDEEYLSLINEVIYCLTQPKIKKDPVDRAFATRSREILEQISLPVNSHLAEWCELTCGS